MRELVVVPRLPMLREANKPGGAPNIAFGHTPGWCCYHGQACFLLSDGRDIPTAAGRHPSWIIARSAFLPMNTGKCQNKKSATASDY
jgi:hypothetical protein